MVQKQHAVTGIVDEIQIVGGNQLGAGQVIQNLNQPAAVARVQRGGGLIHQNQFRVQRQDARDGRQLLLPAGQPVDRPVGAALKLHPGKGAAGAVGNLLRRVAVVFGGKGYIGLHGGHKELAVGILKDIADFAAQLRQIFAVHRKAADGQRALLHRQNADQQLEQRGLAHTVAAHKANALSALQREGKAIQHSPLMSALIAEGEALYI